MNEESIETKDEESFDLKAMALIEKESKLQITDDEGCIAGDALLKTMKSAIKDIKAHFKPFKQELDKKKKRILEKEKTRIAEIEVPKKSLTEKIDAYTEIQEKLAREEARKKEEAARKEAERQAAEEAAKLQEEGKASQAQTVLEEEVKVEPAKVEKVMKRSGSRKMLRAEIVDVPAYLLWLSKVASNLIDNDKLLQVFDIKGYYRETNEPVDGVKFYKERV